MGQNFLIDANIKNKIIASANLNKDDIVLEIGCGLGQLSIDLSKSVKKVIAVEFDRKIFSILSDLIKDYQNIVLIHEDFLKLDLKQFMPDGRKIKVVSNLPYCISTPVILKLFACNQYIDCAYLTLQKEVAQRLTAKPGTKEYGSLTLFTEFHSLVTRLFDISRHCFYPIPKVDSSTISLKMKDLDHESAGRRADLFELIRISFSARRKTMVNALSSHNYKKLSKETLFDILLKVGQRPEARAEALDLSQFKKILTLIEQL